MKFLYVKEHDMSDPLAYIRVWAVKIFGQTFCVQLDTSPWRLHFFRKPYRAKTKRDGRDPGQ